MHKIRIGCWHFTLQLIISSSSEIGCWRHDFKHRERLWMPFINRIQNHCCSKFLGV